MRRRDFMTVLGGAAAWTLPAQGPQSAMPVIGYLGLESPELFASRVAAFRKGLAEAGYAEGRNVAIVSMGGAAIRPAARARGGTGRSAGGRPDRARRRAGRARGESGDRRDPDRLRDGRRSD